MAIQREKQKSQNDQIMAALLVFLRSFKIGLDQYFFENMNPMLSGSAAAISKEPIVDL
ncbi:hypothetical protein L248_3042 [Schleiferilactobacillus shenzhenensis LY-73]|uniref:Uncharacterized protein n=1 Tax=Schleiferilactobacillus shenzhenensis LY-73 TaxID=1231336 RepID=U4TLM2_9LACO|nr:hypothetical protein L248_3042 [Schleiferilactobacillus shenzhenensis LY-73]